MVIQVCLVPVFESNVIKQLSRTMAASSASPNPSAFNSSTALAAFSSVAGVRSFELVPWVSTRTLSL
jgi:hypothetical protein